jgi:hypothetical protein
VPCLIESFKKFVIYVYILQTILITKIFKKYKIKTIKQRLNAFQFFKGILLLALIKKKVIHKSKKILSSDFIVITVFNILFKLVRVHVHIAS